MQHYPDLHLQQRLQPQQILQQQLYTALSTARETSDTAVRVLSGEQIADTGMDMSGGTGLGDNLPPVDGSESDMDSDLGAPPEADGFDATDAAVGGEEELGRERR